MIFILFYLFTLRMILEAGISKDPVYELHELAISYHAMSDILPLSYIL